MTREDTDVPVGRREIEILVKINHCRIILCKTSAGISGRFSGSSTKYLTRDTTDSNLKRRTALCTLCRSLTNFTEIVNIIISYEQTYCSADLISFQPIAVGWRAVT